MSFKQNLEQFVKREGRRPRILVSNMGNESHDHGTKQLAMFFAESGFDVDISPLHQTPGSAARMAIENDVHVICLLSNESWHKNLIAGLTAALKAEQAENVKILMSGAIPRSDYNFLHGAGVDLILNSGQADKAELKRLLVLLE